MRSMWLPLLFSELLYNVKVWSKIFFAVAMPCLMSKIMISYYKTRTNSLT